MDLDSTEDSGVTFESAKMKVTDFVAYVLGQIPPLSLYAIDGTILADRTITALGRFTKWVGGNVTVKMADAINNYGFTVEDNVGTEKAEMGYDQATASGFLKIDNNDLYVNDGFVGVGTASISGAGEKLRINGSGLIDMQIGLNGELPQSNSAITVPRNSTGIAFSSSGACLYESTTGVTLNNATSSTATKPLLFNIGANRNVGEFIQGSAPLYPTLFKIKGLGATSSVTNRPSILVQISQYWDGTASQDKESNIAHNTTSTSGNSQLDFKISGSTLATMMDNGRVGVGTTNPHTSAKLEVSAEQQGFLKPRMSTANRDGMPSPAEGLEIYNTTTQKMNFYNGEDWIVITSA
jgi:hypothetical protein